MRCFRWVSMMAVTLAALVAAGGALAAGGFWSTNNWSDAQQRAGFPLRYPSATFGLKRLPGASKLILGNPCAGGSEAVAQWGSASFGPHERYLSLSQTNARTGYWPCSNPGIEALVRTVRIRGHAARLEGYCSPAMNAVAGLPKPPPCSSREVAFDLTWHEGPAWITAESWGIHSSSLIDWARQLERVG
jgi:hypothetical protein